MQQGTTAQPKPMMTIQESVKTCLRKYADFSGRATRAEFWWWVLATVIASFVIGAVDGFINSLTGAYSFSPLSTIFGLAVLLPDLAVTCRRLHDIGKSGWWQLVWVVMAIIGFIPVASGIAFSAISAYSSGSGWDSLGELSFWIPIAIGLAISVLVWLGLFVWWLIWMVRPSQPGPNVHGPDPHAWASDSPQPVAGT